jgi:nucleotide-binding universal stress UspA family protein
LPVRGGPTAERALEMALALAEQMRVPLSVMHNVPHSQAEELGAFTGQATLVEARGEEPYIVFNEHLQAAEAISGVPIERILTVGGDPAERLLAEAHPDDFLIMGTPRPLTGGSNLPLVLSRAKFLR